MHKAYLVGFLDITNPRFPVLVRTGIYSCSAVFLVLDMDKSSCVKEAAVDIGHTTSEEGFEDAVRKMYRYLPSWMPWAVPFLDEASKKNVEKNKPDAEDLADLFLGLRPAG